MGRFRGRSRISSSKYIFNAILLLELSFFYTSLSITFYSFYFLYKMGRFGVGLRDPTFIYKMVKGKLYVNLYDMKDS